MTQSHAQSVQRVEVRPAGRLSPRGRLRRDLERARVLGDLLDDRFEVAGVRFGFDSLIGLVPGVGDLATAGLSLYPVYLAGRHGLGSWTVARMLGNVVLDFLIGLVPLVGDLADMGFKANKRNVALFRRAAERKLGRGGRR